MNMNNHHDPQRPDSLDNPDSLDTLDTLDTLDILDEPTAALEAQLRAHFAAASDAPPAADALWQRLAPRLDTRAAPTATAVADPSAAPHSLEQRSQPEADAPFLASPRRPSRPHRAQSNRLAQAISSVGALAAVLLISLAAVAIFNQRASLETGNGQVIQRGQLTWHKLNLPPGVSLREGEGVGWFSSAPLTSAQATATTAALAAGTRNAIYQVAPENGNVAYIFGIPATGAGSPRLWRTDDAGSHWSLLPNLPTSATFADAYLLIDQNDPHTIVVEFAHPLNGYASTDMSFVLFDGASKWQPLTSQVQPFNQQLQGAIVSQFSSAHGAYYALRNGSKATQPNPLPPDLPQPTTQHPVVQTPTQGNLYISTDQMQSWHAIDAPLIAEELAAAKRLKLNGTTSVEHFWAQPQTGELLAQTYDGVLWRSVNQGQTWTQINLPALPPASQLTPTPGEMISEAGTPTAAWGAFVQQPIGNRPFTLCALVLDQTLTIFNVAPLYCSTDSGQTWVRRPRPAVPQSNGKPAQFQLPDVMLSDGSLLSWDVTTIYALQGNNTHMPAAYVIGSIPPAHDPNNIPGGTLGVTPHGATLWQVADPLTVYVAQYTAPNTAG